jgi:hypothetical protein
MKVPEAELIVELLNNAFASSFGRIPPWPNGSTLKANFLHGCGFLVIITKGFVLIMEFWCGQLLSVYVQKLSPMEKAHPLFVNHLDCRISNSINNVNNILVCLHIIRHEPLENGRTQPFQQLHSTSSTKCIEVKYKQSCSHHPKISNRMWTTTYMQGNQGNSQLLMIGSQIGTLIPGLSFGHNLCFK